MYVCVSFHALLSSSLKGQFTCGKNLCTNMPNWFVEQFCESKFLVTIVYIYIIIRCMYSCSSYQQKSANVM